MSSSSGIRLGVGGDVGWGWLQPASDVHLWACFLGLRRFVRGASCFSDRGYEEGGSSMYFLRFAAAIRVGLTDVLRCSFCLLALSLPRARV